MQKQEYQKNEKGFSLVEVLLASSILVLIASILIGAYLHGLRNSNISNERNKALLISKEGLEAARSIRDESFESLIDGVYGLNYVNNKWELQSSIETVDSYQRQITIETIDEFTKKVTSTVTWEAVNESGGYINQIAYLTNWTLGSSVDHFLFEPIGGWAMDEGEGNILEDPVNGYDGIIYEAEWVEGISGTALNFDGQNDFVQGDVQLFPDYPYTFSAWIKIPEPLDDDGVIFAIAADSKKNVYYGVYVDEDGFVNIGARNNSLKIATGDILVDDGEWHHIAAVFEHKKSRRVYVDGIMDAENTKNVIYHDSVNAWSIGRWPDKTPDDYFKGIIDEVSVYDKALTDQEILDLYEQYGEE